MLDTLDPSRLADQPVRRRLLALIETSPGIHASQLCREAGEPWGTVQYHLALLHKGELVRAVAAGRERRFFPPGMEDGRMRLLALLNQGRRHEVAAFIRDHPGTRQVDVCDALDLARKTFRRAVSPLVGEGLIQEKRGLHSNRYFPQGNLTELLGAPVPAGLPEPAPAAAPAADLGMGFA